MTGEVIMLQSRFGKEDVMIRNPFENEQRVVPVVPMVPPTSGLMVTHSSGLAMLMII